MSHIVEIIPSIRDGESILSCTCGARQFIAAGEEPNCPRCNARPVVEGGIAWSAPVTVTERTETTLQVVDLRESAGNTVTKQPETSLREVNDPADVRPAKLYAATERVETLLAEGEPVRRGLAATARRLS
jgi:hypothetical protein